MQCKMCEQQKNITNDPYFIMELETGYVILGWYQRFKGYTVFNCKEHGPELHNKSNYYNKETENCLKYFLKLGIAISDGNNIFLAGNAAIYLSDFYEKKPIDLGMRCGEASYTTKLDDIKVISVNPNGDIVICSFVIGNIYNESITQIINRYNPYENLFMSALLNGGIKALIQLAEANGVTIDVSQYYSACSVCNDIVKKLK